MIDNKISINLNLSIPELRALESALAEFSEQKMQEITKNILSNSPVLNIETELLKVQTTSSLVRHFWKKFGVLLV